MTTRTVCFEEKVLVEIMKQEDAMGIVGWYCSNNKHNEKLGHRPSERLYRSTWKSPG